MGEDERGSGTRRAGRAVPVGGIPRSGVEITRPNLDGIRTPTEDAISLP